jgi:membrane peptidoglycan carboxypeptidase
MTSASIHAYLDGRETMQTRRAIITDYLNTMPLAGIRGFGEVIGMADGVQMWYGDDFDEVNRALRSADPAIAGLAYRQVLTLLLANRRPSYFLVQEEGKVILERTTDRYLPLLRDAGIIPPALADAALQATPRILDVATAGAPSSFVGRKAAVAVRNELLGLLGTGTLYELDRYDLTVNTTIDRGVQHEVDSILSTLRDRESVQSMGMEGFRLLGSSDPASVYYAVTLYEARPEGNVLRLQSDNFEGPFNVNEGSKLELGSTAKLRTLVNYLQIVERLHRQYSGTDLSDVPPARGDPITSWAVVFLRRNPDATLDEMLEAALNRTYSASPYEQFFTGGGLHVFHNFSGSDSTQRYTVRAGLRHSVNLVFIRLLRDITGYYTSRLPGNPGAMLQDASDPRRMEYLRRFADREGRQFLWKFYRRYEGVNDVWPVYVEEHHPTKLQLAWAVRSVDERGTLFDFMETFARSGFVLTRKAAEDLFERADVSAFNWQDRGYLAGVHPLELWYLRHRRFGLTWNDMVLASTAVRQEVYQWHFTRTSKGDQDKRIRTLIEEDAFAEIHKDWRQVGYPFDRLVPSYATAIGSSADRPQALAELVGIILRSGWKYPSFRISELHLAEGTPYETRLTRSTEAPQKVLSDEVASALRGALVDVVENGTGRRIYRAFADSSGAPLVVGGKTGTGDNRTRIYGSSGQLLGAEVQNRTSTFVFFIDDRFFGTVTAFVTGPDAKRYGFTSSLPVQLLKALGPTLTPLLQTDPAQ